MGLVLKKCPVSSAPDSKQSMIKFSQCLAELAQKSNFLKLAVLRSDSMKMICQILGGPVAPLAPSVPASLHSNILSMELTFLPNML